MASIFSNKRSHSDFIEDKEKTTLGSLPLRKREISSILIMRGDFIIVGGRKHQEKLFIHNYVISPHSKNK
jgi:hypothetical protein